MIAVDEFEELLCDYTGAPDAVAVDSCTNAIELVCRYLRPKEVTIPRYTWVGVGHAIKGSNAHLWIEDREWRGTYQLRPTRVWDCARRFTSDMYKGGTIQCVSFHRKKILKAPVRGGAILLDDPFIASELRLMRRNQHPTIKSMHCYMTSDVAAVLSMRLLDDDFPLHNADLPNDPNYPDLMQIDWNAMT